MLSRINSKRMKAVVIFCGFCLLLFSSFIELYSKNNMHHILSKAATLTQQQLKFSESMMQLGWFLFWVASILILFAIQNFKQPSVKSVVARTSLAFVTMMIIKVILSIAINDFSFTWISFAIEMAIFYGVYLIIGILIFLFAKSKVSHQQSS